MLPLETLDHDKKVMQGFLISCLFVLQEKFFAHKRERGMQYMVKDLVYISCEKNQKYMKRHSCKKEDVSANKTSLKEKWDLLS